MRPGDTQAELEAQMKVWEEAIREGVSEELQEAQLKIMELSVKIAHLQRFCEHRVGCPRRYKFTRRVTGPCNCGLDRELVREHKPWRTWMSGGSTLPGTCKGEE